jgi:hypothetical protein
MLESIKIRDEVTQITYNQMVKLNGYQTENIMRLYLNNLTEKFLLYTKIFTRNSKFRGSNTNIILIINIL